MSNAPDSSQAGRIEIRLPHNSLVDDDSVWEDLERYLFDGFLTSRAEVQGQSFVFKTVNLSELRYMNFLQKMGSNSTNSPEFRATFIAHSIFLVNGSNALYERPKHIERLIKTIKKLQPAVLEKTIERLTILNEKANRLFPLIEVYVNENRSRYRWYQIRDSQINDPSVTGIAGSDVAGMNFAQLTWVALNRIQDLKESAEKDWQHAKFIGGCFAGKGIRAIEDRDKTRLERERVEREELKMKVLYQYLNRTSGDDSLKEQVSLPDGRLANVESRHRAESAEELARQLTSALNNEKDAHDLAIEAYEKKMRERAQEIEEERKQLLRQNAIIDPLPMGSSVIPEAKVSERVKRMRELMVENFRQVDPNDRTLDP